MEEFEEAGKHNEWLGGYVKSVKKEVDELEEQIGGIKQEIEKYKELSHDNNREKIVEKLTEEL